MQDSDNTAEVPAVKSRARTKTPALNATSLLIEIGSIVLGVLLALGLSEWNENRNMNARAESALQKVNDEVRYNSTVLTAIHESNSEAVQNILKRVPVAPDEDRGFIPGLQLRETAWETFLNAGLSSYSDYDQVISLSELYAAQEMYKGLSNQLVASSMTMTAMAAAQDYEVSDAVFGRQFAEYLEMLVGLEAELLQRYENLVGTDK